MLLLSINLSARSLARGNPRCWLYLPRAAVLWNINGIGTALPLRARRSRSFHFQGGGIPARSYDVVVKNANSAVTSAIATITVAKPGQ